MSVTAQFFGGPADGEIRSLESPAPEISMPSISFAVPALDATPVLGRHIYRLSARYQLPPLRYDYVGHTID